MASLVEFGRAGQRSPVALPAGRLHILRRQDWLLPGEGAAVGFLDGGGSALSAVTHHAAELIERMRNDGMPAKRLGRNIRQAGFLQSYVAGSATIDDSEAGKPYLVNPALEMALQRHRVSATSNQREILLLIVAPLAEVIFRRRDG